ncbi:MAG TPA: hypothetical protein PKC28_07245 [Bdellovibrionales bacterium]|nr:hypothetical protein [Bdellovibrionales bacterium]
MKNLVLVTLIGLWTSFAQATIQDEFEALKDSARDYEITGTVCEEVARLETARDRYPESDYTVVTGIAYSNGHRTIGELDVVVFENRTGRVREIAEVKCWRNMHGGLRKAEEQRQRFLDALHSGRPLEFRSTSANHQRFDARAFQGVNAFNSIAQKGAVDAGYTSELDYSLNELMELRQMMIKCQHEGHCARPR